MYCGRVSCFNQTALEGRVVLGVGVDLLGGGGFTCESLCPSLMELALCSLLTVKYVPFVYKDNHLFNSAQRCSPQEGFEVFS